MRPRVIVAATALFLPVATAVVPAASTALAVNPGDIVITEVMQNPLAVADGSGEWFEVTNVSTDNIDLNGWTVADNDTDSFVINTSIVVPAGGTAVLGNNPDSTTNGGVTVDYDYGSSWFLANGADEVVLLDDNLTEIDRIEWDGGPNWPDPNGASMSLDPASTTGDNNIAANWCEATTPFGAGDLGTPGTANTSCVVLPPAPVAVKIHEIQGSSPTPNMLGERVIIEGVVVGDHEGPSPELRGFFVQEEDVDADDFAETSEGIFVFNFNNDDVSLGDVVRVEGTVQEQFGNTQLGEFVDIEILDVEARTTSPAVVEFPVVSVESLEAVEGMAATFPQTLVISEYFNYDRFGEIVVALPALDADRPMNPTAVYGPDTEEAADLAELNELSRITVDDGITSQNPADPIHPINRLLFSEANSFRGGDQVSGLTGPVYFAFDLYRILPYESGGYETFVQTEGPMTPDDVGGGLQIGSLNTLNYFLTLDDGTNDICGPDQNLECRGADTADELDRQRVKLLNTLEGLDADIIGLMEVENRPGVEVLADIVSGLNDRAGAPVWSYVAAGENGVVGTDAIKVGIIYRTDKAGLLDDAAVLDDASFLDPNNTGLDRNRAAVAASFVDRSTGGVVSVVVNHFKSKGSGCGFGDDDPLAGSCDVTRTMAAQVLVDWLADDPTGVGDSDWMILGDLNSYDQEAPITTLTAAGYADLIGEFGGEFAYSYVFDGEFGYLDYLLSSGSLTAQVTGATEWHVNADEPDIYDYDNSFKSDYQASLFDATDPFRSSDHDPALAGVDLDTDAAVVLEWVEVQVGELQAAGSLDRGQGNSLFQKLAQARRQLDRGQVSGALGILTGVREQLADFVDDGILTGAEAEQLIVAIDAIRSGLS